MKKIYLTWIKESIIANKESICVILFFTILGYLYLGANLFTHQIVAPMDLLLHYTGWSNTGIHIPITNLERSDILDALIPQWNFARDALLQGIFPLWNPYTAGGTPLLSLIQSSLLTPSFLFYLIFGGGLGFSISLLVKLSIGSIGTYKLCRTELGVIPSIFGGITFMMCGFNASWLMWPQVTTSIWIPWLLWGLILLNDERSKIRFLIVALVTALLIFGGFPFVSFCGLLVGSLFIFWLAYISHKNNELKYIIKPIVISFSAIFSGILLASIQIFPFIEYIRQVDVLSWHKGGTNFSINDLDILWSPFKYAHQYGDHIAPNVGLCGAVGVLTLVFSIVAIFVIIKYRYKIFSPLSPCFWGMITLLTFIPLFNIWPVSTIIYQMPIFNSNLSTRLLVVIGLSFAILGAYGFNCLSEYLLKVTDNKNKLLKIAILGVFIAIITVQIIDLSVMGISQNAVVPEESFFPITPTIRYIQDNIHSGQSVLTTSGFLVSGTITYYNISDWFAHSYHSETEKLILGKIVNSPFASPTAALYVFNQIDLKSPYIDQLGIRYIVGTPNSVSLEDSNNWTVISLEKGFSIFENNDCPNGAYIIDNSGNIDKSLSSGITTQEYTPNYRRYSVDTPRSVTFVTTNRYFSGWQAYVNGTPLKIEPYLGILQSVQIPKGHSEVIFEYVPFSFYFGLFISIITGIFLIWLPKKTFQL